ncbi:MAG: HDOD domain-containing protein [Steroidobacteraceae bacterium]|jgi:HD-like signal output (HDOD) protein
MTSAPQTTDSAPGAREASAEAFEFVRELALELSAASLELPSYPEVALRVQRVLSDMNADSERVVRVLGADPVLAARVLTLANSAAINPTGKAVTELRRAVVNLGFDALRTAAMSFALNQLRKAASYKDIKDQMSAQWEHSTAMASYSYVLARKSARFNPDTAMLAGLISGVGKLYILTRARRHPVLFGDDVAYQGIVRDWHGNIARALLDNWQIADEIVTAVQSFEEAASEPRNTPHLADVLAVAASLIDAGESLQMLLSNPDIERPFKRLGLDFAAVEGMRAESRAEIESLRVALG